MAILPSASAFRPLATFMPAGVYMSALHAVPPGTRITPLSKHAFVAPLSPCAVEIPVVVSVVMLSPNTMNEFAKYADVSLVGGTPQNAMVRPSALRYG